MKSWPTYILINLGLLFGVGLIFVHVYFIQPLSVPCLLREVTGSPCASCGFTRAFASFLQFNFQLGKSFNELALPVFLFFAGQVVLRVCMVVAYYFISNRMRPQLAKLDVAVSISVFLLAFLPVLNLN